MDHRPDRPGSRLTATLRPVVDPSDEGIHNAVSDCIQNAADDPNPLAIIRRYVQWLIGQGWNQEMAEQVGSRAIVVMNAMHPPSCKINGR